MKSLSLSIATVATCGMFMEPTSSLIFPTTYPPSLLAHSGHCPSTQWQPLQPLHPPRSPLHRLHSSGSENNENDEVKQLLEKARKLREEAAAMSGQSVEEMEEERRKQKEQMAQIEAAKSDSHDTSDRSATSANRIIPVPDTAKSQVEQAASAVERAYRDGITRQMVRFALIGEEERMSGEVNEWPGGAKQMYREAGRPLTEALLREVRAIPPTSNSNIDRTPPTITTEEIWDFDGSALITATYPTSESSQIPQSSQSPSESPKSSESSSPSSSPGTVQALLFPNTDTKYLTDIDSLSTSLGPSRLFLLVNPFWRNLDDWGFNLLAPNAKKRAKEIIYDNPINANNANNNINANGGYELTYACLRFSVRGEDCVALKSYPYDWQMYAYREDPSWFNQEVPLWLGSSGEEPTSQMFRELLDGRKEFRMSKNMRQMQRMMGRDDQ